MNEGVRTAAGWIESNRIASNRYTELLKLPLQCVRVSTGRSDYVTCVTSRRWGGGGGGEGKGSNYYYLVSLHTHLVDRVSELVRLEAWWRTGAWKEAAAARQNSRVSTLKKKQTTKTTKAKERRKKLQQSQDEVLKQVFPRGPDQSLPPPSPGQSSSQSCGA
ncbi:hypothetical protein BO70DRAFT_135302 [Aspergillus heteromorphus CBS 117.55]|uniref:Uncharacterized protein n=1 Tax=Aspergillus heteromorphus CBS 117.55 TaxID=1448321 RepID=A0A317WW95_9EURO|nr:uncharacterized protein BO70DRAFT_135302 [Aspergillus heteromorphus CBS 117.55]PWY90161.1 hypothetical protein BO70DRAFT_135302 [Aspergillus heteromorphus CBS 117.55]